MLPFRNVTLNDKELIDRYARQYPTRLLNYSFEVLYLWQSACDFMICEYDGLLLIKTFYYCNHNYFFPMGEGDIAGAMEEMIEYSHRFKCPFSMIKVNDTHRNLLEELFPDRFVFDELRDEMEYIYPAEKLITLAGKHLQPKRNHINAFLKEQAWSLEEISAENINEVRAYNREWESCIDLSAISKSMEIECEAVNYTLANYGATPLNGLLLRINGKVEGFSIGCPTFSDTYLTLFERANGAIRGCYPLLNREFSRRFASNRTYINRAEDCGDEGLRKAKLSYHPAFLDKLYLVSLHK